MADAPKPATAAVKPAVATPAAAGAVPIQPAKPAAPPFVIHPLGGYSRWLKALVYGDYGTGKTLLVGSSALVPQMQDILFIDCEAGDLTIATEGSSDYNREAHAHIDVVKAMTFKDLARIQEFLKLHCQYRDSNDEDKLRQLEMRLMGDNYDASRPLRKYRTVIIDSLTEAESFSMYQLLGISDRTRLDEEVASPEWTEYKRNHSQILRMIRQFRDLPMNVLMTAASSYVQDEQKRMLFQPALTGKLAKQCQGFMDLVAYMYVTADEQNKKLHMVQAQPTPRINAKCRFSNFKDMGWKSPTMYTILESVGLLEKVGKK